MAEELQGQGGEVIEAAPARPLKRSEPGPMVLWGHEFNPLAVAATAGAAAGVGVAAIAFARASRPTRRPARRGLLRRRERVIGSRSFLVDIHLLGSKGLSR
jgi:hypothetical protein